MGLLSHTAMVFVGDSDDSDTEGGLGNIENLIMRPPGHSGKAKRGHLCFDASFETGNLGRVDFITENEYDLFIRPDTCNPRTRFWFHFAVDNVQKDQRIIFNIVNVSKQRNLFQKGFAPVVKSTSRPKWQRLPSEQAYYYKSPEHSDVYVLSFVFTFDAEEQHGRTLPMVMISSREDPEASKPKDEPDQIQSTSDIESDEEDERNSMRPIIVIIARSHAGDSNTSYIVHGMLDFLCSNHTIAEDLRKHVDFLIFPMLNPDGVFLGNSRSNLFGVDLNRVWHKISFKTPELQATRDLTINIAKEKRLDFIIDLHGNTTLTGLFVQGNSFDSVYRFERHLVFPKLLSQNCPDFESENSMFNADVEKEGACRRFFNKLCGEDGLNVYTVEVSYYGFINESGSITPYTEEDFLMHGRRIARSLWEYYKVTKLIPSVESNIAQESLAETGKENAFSMIRLRNIAHQKDIFSSLESFTDSDNEDDDEKTSKSKSPMVRSPRVTPRLSPKFGTKNPVKVSIPLDSLRDIHHSSSDSSLIKNLAKKTCLPPKEEGGSFQVIGKSIDVINIEQGTRFKSLEFSDSEDEVSDTPFEFKVHQARVPNVREKTFSSILGVQSLSSFKNSKVETFSSNSEDSSTDLRNSPLLIRSSKFVGGGGGQITPKSKRRLVNVSKCDDEICDVLNIVGISKKAE